MKTLITWLLCGGLLCGLYIRSQQPKVWCNRNWICLSLEGGGYRSWSVTFHDVLSVSWAKDRAYFPPRFTHVDLRGKSESLEYFLEHGPLRFDSEP